jgi:predicted Zn-dependent protease
MTLALALLLAAGPGQSFAQLSEQAAAARQANRAAEAARLYRRAVAARPEWAEGWWYLGALSYEQDKYADAVPAFTRFVKLKPDSAAGWSLLGLSEYGLRQHEAALAHLRRANALGLELTDPLSRTARYHRAVLETHFGRFEAALDDLKNFSFPAVETPAIIEAIGVAALHLPLLPGELPEERRSIAVRTGRAVYDSWAARSADAEREFRELILSYPEDANLRYLFGSFLLQSDTEAALKELRRCLELDPKYVPALLQIAFEYLTRHEAEQGVGYAEQAVKLAPDSYVARNALGRLLVERGDLKRGTAELEAAVKLAPDSPECHFALASAYTKAERKQEAAREQAEFLRLQRLAEKK